MPRLEPASAFAESIPVSKAKPEADNPRAKKRHHNQAGFTLLELVIVMAIIALMAAVISPMLFNRLKEARVNTTRQQISLLDDALGSYRLDVGKYPTSEQGLRALIEQPEGVDRWAGPYTGKRKLPKDGWEHDFVYRYPPDPGDEAARNEGRDFDLFSLGADGKPGGEGEDADVY